MYSTQELTRLAATYSQMLRANYQEVILAVLTREESAALSGVTLTYPLSDNHLIPFGVGIRPGGKYIAVPIFTVQFLFEFAIAFNWLSKKKPRSIDKLFTYLLMLKYTSPESWPGGRYLSPIKALGIPPSALADKKTMDTAVWLMKSYVVYLISRQVGALVLTYPAGDWASTTAEQNESLTIQSDAFGLDVLRRLAIPPTSLCFYIPAEMYWTPFPIDFPTTEQYQRFVGSPISGAVTDRRVFNLAHQMTRAASDLSRLQKDPQKSEAGINQCAESLLKFPETLRSRNQQERLKREARTTSFKDLLH